METAILRERYDDTLSSEAIFSKSVRGALHSLLGDSAGKALCYYLNLGSADVGPVVVQKRIREIVGDGAGILERAIVMEFYRGLNLPHEVVLRLDPSPSAVSSRFDFVGLVAAGMQMRVDVKSAERGMPILPRER